MELDKDNANPTILNPSDLPSRRSDSLEKKRDHGGTGLFDDLVPAYNYLSDPFERTISSSDSDDDSVEDIDAQEIYGGSPRTYTCCSIRGHFLWTGSDHHRPHLVHFRPRAPTVLGFISRGEPAGYPHPTTYIPVFVNQHCTRGDYSHHHTLLAGHSHWFGRASAARAGPTPSVSARCAYQEGHA
jgi:hypothetical protein